MARRATVLIDGEAYFTRLARCLATAQRSVFIIGWDFDASIRLEPRLNDQRVGELLRNLVIARPELHIRVLVWSEAIVHAPGASLPLLFGDEWSAHPRIRVELDRGHPLYAAHHQKIVSIDDEIAFVGGMDLTVDRWDTPRHRRRDARRVTPGGEAYDPVHDVQMVVQGPAARALADIARERWRDAVGEDVATTSTSADAWPADLRPDFENVPIAVSRVSPQWHGRCGCEESFRMTLDAIDAAEDSIYIEAQYFTSRRVGETIARSLAKPRGPEIVVVVGLNSHGLVEQYVMANNRDRLTRRLLKADRHDRFRIYYPILPSGKDLKLHSKVITVDDTFLRIGSSNLNNRSEGLDTECDVAIEARDSRTANAIAELRDTLLAEHLGAEPTAVRRIVSEERSLIRAIERLNGQPRSLKPLPALSKTGSTKPVFGTWLLDPARPLFQKIMSRRNVAPVKPT